MMINEGYFDAMRSTFAHDDSFRPLHELATDELSSGTPRETLLAWHEEARARFAEREDVILEVMDCLAGWCATEMRIEPRPLGAKHAPTDAA